MTLEVRLLGPMRVLLDGRQVALGARKQRLVLAILALEAGHAVPVERLVDLVWPEGATRTAEHAVRVCVSGLRAALRGAVEILTQGSGYLLAVEPSTVDAHQFRALVASARAATEDAERVSLLDAALALWSGPALAGTAPPAIQQRLCAGLEEARLAATEDRSEALLGLGRHRELAVELVDLIARHPLRERLVGAQMVALYRSGRTVDALEAYQRLRKDLADELGLDPGAELQRIHVAILRDEEPATGPAGAGAVGRPAQLPSAVAGFVGRSDELASLTDLAGAASAAAPVAVIGGTAGVGKTALAVDWAHRHRGRYPDGQLYVNLRGFGPGTPMRPEHALAGFLRALGIPAEQIPVDLDEAAALYRSQLADRRVLVLLDNAVGVEQARPLLPGGAGCLALVTSRERLAGLAVRDGARLLRLSTLPNEDSVRLLGGLLGAARLAAEPEKAAELARLCGHLPLALRIAAAQLVRHPDRSIADLVVQLAKGDRLGVLMVEGDEMSAVRATLDLSYVALKPETRQLFRFVGLLPGADLTAPAVAALLGRPVGREVLRSLAELVDAHLLDEPVAGRYLLHDLLRLYAQALVETEESAAARDAATARLYEFYLRTADAAANLLYPQLQRLPLPPPAAPVETADLADQAAAMAWLDAERANLVAAVERAAADGPHPVAWLIVDTLRGYFWTRKHTTEWSTAAAAALGASTVDNHDQGLAVAYTSLAQLEWFRSENDEAVAHYQQALTHARRAGWHAGEAAATGSLGNVFHDLGRLADAAECYRRARVAFRETRSTSGEAVSLTNLGNVLWQSGELREAESILRQALEIYQCTSPPAAQASVLDTLGCVYRDQGRLDEALDVLVRSAALYRDAASPREAEPLYDLADLHLRAGQLDEARRLARASLDIVRDWGYERVEAHVCHVLAALDRREGRSGGGWEDRSLELFRRTGYRYGEALALIGIAESRLLTGDRPGANRAADEAIELARRHGFRLVEAEAAAMLAAPGLAHHQPADGSATGRRPAGSERL